MSQVVANLLVNGLNPVTVGGTGTTAKFFPAAPGASIGVASSKVGYVYLPGNSSLNGQPFTVEAVGNVTVDPTIACPTILVELVATTNPTAASPTYVAIAASTTHAPGQGSGDAFATQPWLIRAQLNGDSASGFLQGTQIVIVDNTVVTSLAAAVAITGVNFGAPVPVAFAVRFTFGTSGAGNSASMYNFTVQA